jgi:carotenoid cleavage dioxygenase-like enzyme
MSELEITHRYNKALHPEGREPPHAPAWTRDIDNPYLHGLYAPTTVESDANELTVVEGELPRDLFGAYFRNGPNAEFAPKNRYHWFDGDGMVHGIWFEDGKARYKSRYVRTAGLTMERDKGEAIWPGVLGPFDFSLPLAPIKDTANTDLVYLGDQLFALWYESGALYALDPRTLETTGAEDFDGKLPIRVSAHSKVDPATGDFLFFSYGDRPPFMQYGVVRPDRSVHLTEITLPGPRRPHDLGFTPRYTVLHDFPIFFDEDLFKKTGKRIPLFHPEVPTRYGVLPRFGADDDVKWFEFKPCYMLHVVNCWEEGDWVVMLGCRTADPSLKPDKRDGKIAAMLSGLKVQANLYRWRMNLKTGETDEGPLDELNAEFPTLNRAHLGQKNRWAYEQVMPCEIPATFDGIVKYELDTGAHERFMFDRGVFGSESPFAPRVGGTDEDDGYLVSFMTDANTWESSCWVFNAKALKDGPIAKVALPERIPAGFHALWVPGEQLPG